MGEFGSSDKGAKKNSSVNKVQGLEAFPSSSKEMMTMMMTVHHNHHHHRPLSPFHNDSRAAGDGPSSYASLCNNNNNINHINDVASVSAAAIHSGAASAAVRNLQPFDISISNSIPAVTPTTLPAFKSPGGMTGFPFTNAQLKELERQAMIYKYMMASVPIPPDLLTLISLQAAAAARSPLENGFNLRLSSSTDSEPGRCRRTDGKKWRCSRDVAPNHKYCERHMHRGRPRSRKPVEVHANSNISSDNSNQQLKKPRHESHPFQSSDVTVAIPNTIIRKNGPSSQPYHDSSFTFDRFGVKAANFESLTSVSSTKELSGLDWMLKGDPISLAASNPEWQSLMQNRVGLNTQSYPNYPGPMYPNLYPDFHSELDQQNRRLPPFLNPLTVPMENLESHKPRGFIDAWSNAETDEKYANPNRSSVASNNKLSPFSLELSMGGGSSVDEEIGNIEMGLGLVKTDGNTEAGGTKTHYMNWLPPAAPWVASTTPGGPLAEVLRPSRVAAANEAASNSSSPVITNAESSSPLATMVSSSSGVLQKTFASLSDSSSSSSPTVAFSGAGSDIAIMWFN